MNGQPIHKPEDHDWSGCLCTFRGLIVENKPVIGADGCIEKGDTKLSGIVIDQKYLGQVGSGLIPDFEINVRGASGAVLKIKLLDNRFQVVE